MGSVKASWAYPPGVPVMEQQNLSRVALEGVDFFRPIVLTIIRPLEPYRETDERGGTG